MILSLIWLIYWTKKYSIRIAKNEIEIKWKLVVASDSPNSDSNLLLQLKLNTLAVGREKIL